MNTHVSDASELANVTWRRSSRSGSGGGACVEVGAVWRRSSYSGPNGGACVEVGGLGASMTGVRDSKDPSGPALLFGADAWDGFLSGVKADRFDR
ncbi:DUF397 domain-containing protein [Saccharopolyspora spinosa]|uniref:Uncharacterized protein DUF397 n=1 Tax=Saccharopolyspora spinosa TaxID=60894 RepID=A0A2N3Y8G1_SACSN|nr:DUF397 domain-containing protein [Saccharopolyspora spinosa]PKW19151.1 uncharacterized protein DUF397 [Saccharopolyspora spinosa]